MLASILTKSLQSRNPSFKDSWNQLLAEKILFTSWTLKTHLLKRRVFPCYMYQLFQ